MFLLRKSKFAIFLVSFLVGFFHTPKRPAKSTDQIDPLFFAGTWYFTDRRKREHRIEIGPDLQLTIDGENLSAKVSEIQKYEVSYIDRYGYKLEIRANETRPVKFYDESENMTFYLRPDSARLN